MEKAGCLIFHHEDHLTGANVDTDTDGQILQLLDYFPFGQTRIDESAEEYHNDYGYTGKELDAQTALSYYEARYYDSRIGRFISYDPVVMAIGSPELEKLAGKKQGEILADPQNLNSYSYAKNNPITLSDPNGTCYICAPIIGLAFLYAPQITSYLSSLNTLVGQYSINAALNDVKQGSYGWAAIGMVTAGETGGGTAKLSQSQFKKAVDFASEKLGDLDKSIFPSKSEVTEVMSKWVNTNMPDEASSILFHYGRHADGNTLGDLTKNGLDVWNNYLNKSNLIKNANNVLLENGENGIRVKLSNGRGGIFTEAGGIVSSWFRSH